MKNAQIVGFVQTNQTCFESCGTVAIKVERQAAFDIIKNTTLTISFVTNSGTAQSNVNFEPVSSKVTMQKGEYRAEVFVPIIDISPTVGRVSRTGLTPSAFMRNTSGGQEEIMPLNFTVEISKLVTRSVDASKIAGGVRVIESRSESQVTILKDNFNGVFVFDRSFIRVPGICGHASVKIVRLFGSRGSAEVSFRVQAKSAEAYLDFIPPPPALCSVSFDQGQTEAFVKIQIVDRNRSASKQYTFAIELAHEPTESFHRADTPTLGNVRQCQIEIFEDFQLNDRVDQLLNSMNFAFQLLEKWMWPEQIKSMLRFPSKLPHGIVHILLFPWKLLVAIHPPIQLLHGWLAFIYLLLIMLFISILTLDLANHLSCSIGLRDIATSVTILSYFWGLHHAITHRVAVHCKSMSNIVLCRVVSLNIVTVSLGLGLSWTIGSIYRTSNQQELKIPQADITFAVMLHCIFLTSWLFIMIIRKLPPIQGELGGPALARNLAAVIVMSLWVTFVTLVLLEKFCIIELTH